jgi:Fibronectin type III domain
VPGAPTGVTANGGDGSATVTWTAPASDGGSPIIAYTVTGLSGVNAGPTVTVSGSPAPTSATVSNLINGLSYTFTVEAINANGTGPASAASSPVTPSGPPLGNPNNTAGTAIGLPLLNCGQSLSQSGLTANDGSNAWYVVGFIGQASVFNIPCTLHVNLSGSAGTVFDIYVGSFNNSPAAQGVTTASEPSPGVGVTGTYYIHVYDTVPGAVTAVPFGLSLSAS